MAGTAARIASRGARPRRHRGPRDRRDYPARNLAALSRRDDALAHSAAFELRGTLLEERAHSFAEIFRTARDALRLTLQVQLLFVRVVEALPIKAADKTERLGRPVSQIGRECFRLVDQLAVVIYAIYESPLERRFGWQFFAEQRHLHRADLAYQPRKNPGRAAVRDQPDTPKRLKEIRRLRAEDQVAHQRETHPDARRCAINRGYERDLKIANAPHKWMVERSEHEARVRRATRIAAARIARRALQIRTRAKAATLARHHQASHATLRILDLVERLHQPAEHLRRDGVHDLRMVERNDSDTSLDVEFCAIKFHASLRFVLIQCQPFGRPSTRSPMMLC